MQHGKLLLGNLRLININKCETCLGSDDDDNLFHLTTLTHPRAPSHFQILSSQNLPEQQWCGSVEENHLHSGKLNLHLKIIT